MLQYKKYTPVQKLHSGTKVKLLVKKLHFDTKVTLRYKSYTPVQKLHSGKKVVLLYKGYTPVHK